MSGRDARKAGAADARGELLEIVRAARRSLIAQTGSGDRGRAARVKTLPSRRQRGCPKASGCSAASPEGLEAIREEMQNCHRCPLEKVRKNLVFGEGNPHAALVFVGEAPGADEDEQGRPFVGKAGELLTRIILAMGLKREDVYICNILKCRPPGNRNPQPDEIAACEPFLVRQLQAISPRFICALGSFAARTLLKTESPITALRGRFHDYHGIRLMPTYHPAYLLRNPDAKRLVWQDVQMVMKELEA
ncbi:MAG TPA: uracil-DNA glycosylase [Syntrophales bacterium]|nr:uracil-DNA glycosylase [Syntrophales bacterium]